MHVTTALPDALPFLAQVKSRQQTSWATGDFARIGTLIHSTAERLVDTADLQAGWRVLDVATGSGNAALAAARLGCEVVGVDYVPALLERARVRAAAEFLDVEFRDGDAEALPFVDGSFDAVVSIFGAMFAPDQEQTAQELLRVVRPGGRVVMGNWTPTSFVGEMFALLSRYVPPPTGVEPPLRWGTEARLRELFGHQITSLELRPATCVFRFRSASELVIVFRRWFGPLIKALEAIGDARAIDLLRDLHDLAARWNRNEGDPIAIPSEYLEVVAVKDPRG